MRLIYNDLNCLQDAMESTIHQLVFAQTANNSTYVFCMYGDNNLAAVDSLLVCC